VTEQGNHVAWRPRGFSMPLGEVELRKSRRAAEIEAARSPNGAVLTYLREIERRKPLIHATCTARGTLGSSSLEAMLFALAAPTFTGKSFTMAALEGDPYFQPRFEDGRYVTPLLVVNAPSPCPLTTLGTELLNQLGWVGAYPDRRHKVWHAVRQLMIAKGVMAIIINDFHNLILGRKRSEIVELAMALKAILVGDVIVRAPGASKDSVIVNNPPYRFPVFIFAGGTDVIRIITDNMKDPVIIETARRSLTLQFSEIPCSRGEGGRMVFKSMPQFIDTLQKEMGFQPDPRLVSYDMQKRHYKAANRFYGRVACVLKKAATLSVLDGDVRPPHDYLAEAFAELYKARPAKNPYLVADIDSIGFPQTADELERKLRQRGTSDA
jgi:hypothetical protein